MVASTRSLAYTSFIWLNLSHVIYCLYCQRAEMFAASHPFLTISTKTCLIILYFNTLYHLLRLDYYPLGADIRLTIPVVSYKR